MSSKRGRKRNDNLPPNRARDVQRAFRARRAAHLQALEERVAELEEENDSLRTALSLPPANRPPLGRGPTGKDKARPFSSQHSMSQTELGEGSCSPCTSSSSPHSTSLTMSSVTHSGDTGDGAGGSWENALTMPSQDEFGDRDVMQPPHLPVNLQSTTSPFQPEAHFRFDATQPSTSRSNISGAFFMSPGGSGYASTSNRPDTSSSTFSRDESFGLSANPLSPNHGSSSSLRGLASPPSITQRHHIDAALGDSDTHSPMSAHPSRAQQSHHNMAYGIRRSITEPQQHFAPYVDSFPHLSYLQQANALPQQPHQFSDAANRLPPNLPSASRPGYGHEGTTNPSTHRTT